jgi:hypothetical protein
MADEDPINVRQDMYVDPEIANLVHNAIFRLEDSMINENGEDVVDPSEISSSQENQQALTFIVDGIREGRMGHVAVTALQEVQNYYNQNQQVPKIAYDLLRATRDSNRITDMRTLSGDVVPASEIRKNLDDAIEKIENSYNKTRRPSLAGKRTRRKFKMPRKMSKKYCKKTRCRRMGFTQRSSCRPYKNCFNK